MLEKVVLKKEIRIAPKQLRALVLLLLLLPVVPSAILIRFMWDTLEADRRLAWSDQVEVQSSLLALAVREAELSPEEVGGEAATAKEIEAYFEESLGGTAEVSVVEMGKLNAVEGVRFGEGVQLLSRPLGGVFEGSVVEVKLDPEDYSFDASEGSRQLTTNVTVWLLGVVWSMALLAGWALYRQLRSEEMKSDFLATVAHELKTPVASTKLLLDTLRDGSVVDETGRREYLELIARENERQQGTIENFLAYWRLEQGREVFFMDWVAPGEIAKAAVETVRPKVDALGGTLEVHVRPLLCDLKADKEAMITVVSGLLDNAVKYSKGSAEIVLDVFQSGDSVFFEVGDRGVGVEKEDRERIFDRFYRVDAKASRQGGGCGLGLSIAKFIVEAHRGRIGVLDRPREEGAVFWVQIPLASPIWAT